MTVSQMEWFLGLISFYHYFIPEAAGHLQLLHDMHLHCPYSSAMERLEETTHIFSDVKELLSDATLLARLHPLAPIQMSYASDMKISMVL